MYIMLHFVKIIVQLQIFINFHTYNLNITYQ